MNLNDLMEAGGFVPSEPVKKEVTWSGAKGGPVTFTVYIRPPSAGDVERGARALRAAGAGEKDFATRPLMISATVFFDPECKEGFTYAKAFDLKEDLCKVLYAAVTEVIADGAEEAKNSQPPTSSGTSSSPTESAAELSLKPSER